MKQGCIVAVVIVGVLFAGCCGGLVFIGFSYGNPAIIMLVEQSISRYRELYPDRKVENTNQAWFKALTADDSSLENKDQLKQIAPNGEFVDLYQTPLKLVQQPDGAISGVSAGRDKKFDTPDDETSAKIMKLIDKASEKSAAKS